MFKPNNSDAFFDAVEASFALLLPPSYADPQTRRSNYQISNKSTLTDAQLTALVQRAVKHAPSPFMMQETRAIVVTGEYHQRLWDMVRETYKKTMGGDPEKEKGADAQISMFDAGYGTVLFFEDQDVIKEWSGKMPIYSQIFPVWSDNVAGIVQFIVWTALATSGMGASLQHHSGYSAITQARMTEMFDVPPSWKNTALMPFGVPTGPPGNPARPKETQFVPIEPRVKTFFG